jgi:hypothetical protein
MALPNAGTAFIHALSSSSTGALAREGVGEDRPSSETAASTASAHAAKSLAPPPNDRPRPHPPSRSAGNILPSGFARGAGTDSPGRRRLRHLEVPELNSIQFTPSLNAPSRSRVPPHPAATTGAKHAPPCHQGRNSPSLPPPAPPAPGGRRVLVHPRGQLRARSLREEPDAWGRASTPQRAPRALEPRLEPPAPRRTLLRERCRLPPCLRAGVGCCVHDTRARCIAQSSELRSVAFSGNTARDGRGAPRQPPPQTCGRLRPSRRGLGRPPAPHQARVVVSAL